MTYHVIKTYVFVGRLYFEPITGFLRSNSIMLHFFAWTLILLFITLFAGSIAAWAMARSLRKFFKFIFLASVLNYNPDQRWALSGLVDYTQSTMGCCGSKKWF